MTPASAAVGMRQSADAPGASRRSVPATPEGLRRGGRPSRRWPWLVASAAVAVGVAGAGFAAGADGREDTQPPALGPGDVTVELHVEHSLFEPTEIRVVEGTRLRFLVDNDDPINHELIVGGPEVHARHARGTEARHPSVPGEVSVGPNRVGVTTLRFDEPGTFEFACHLPGHYEYGMHGVVEVAPAPA
ncbi:MAG TPA: cupredoxin domain-containing protein [Acidimicrobiales bacterium]|nr:cupredoxin domain-containing protein [Acidimicrobiales bacterium]